MKAVVEPVGFDFRFAAGEVKLCATRMHMPERTFEFHLERIAPPGHFCCGFIEFVEVSEAASSVLARVMQRLHDTTPWFPADFPETAFRDALSHWLMCKFGAPLRHSPAEPAIPLAGATPTIARS